MSVIEYLYMDEKRLESYFEQVSSPLHYDKIPTWKVSLDIKGPSVEANLDKEGRQFTRHEKITAIVEHLEKNNLMETYRPADDERWQTSKVFRLETCRAIRVFIPPKKEKSVSFPGLGLWISYTPHPKHRNPGVRGYPAGALYLLEDFRGEDTDARTSSSYSALDMLLRHTDDVREFLKKSEPEFLENYSHNENGLSFSSHPDQFFAALGAKLGQARLIRTLYRVRATCNDKYSQPHFAVVTIGYPLFIAEG